MTYDEMIDDLQSADNVTVRDTAAIIKAIRDNPDAGEAELAAAILKTQAEAGLMTVIREQLDGYIAAIVERRAAT